MSESLRPRDCSAIGFPVHHQLPELAQAHVHPVSDTIQSSHPLSSPSPPALNLSQHQGLFQWVSSSHQVARKHWNFTFSISPSNEHQAGLISFRMDWLDLLAVQETLKSLLQHHSSKASILQCSAFFIVQLSHPYMTTGKTIALTGWNFVFPTKELNPDLPHCRWIFLPSEPPEKDLLCSTKAFLLQTQPVYSSFMHNADSPPPPNKKALPTPKECAQLPSGLLFKKMNSSLV